MGRHHHGCRLSREKGCGSLGTPRRLLRDTWWLLPPSVEGVADDDIREGWSGREPGSPRAG